MRTLLVTGPGGAGSSTVAAAAALRAARSGRRTLLLTRQPPPAAPRAGDVPGLQVRRISGARALADLWSAHAGTLAGLVPHLTLPPATSVVPLPGSGELAVLEAMARAEADVVVVDAGPLRDALALVALPAALRWWTDQAMPPSMRALAAVRTAAVGAGAVRRGPLDAALSLLPAVEQLLARDRLSDPSGTAVWLTAVARGAAVPALRRATTVLGLHGLRPAGIVARVLPAGGSGDWWAARAAEQDSALAALGEVAPVHVVPEQAGRPDDPVLPDGLDLPSAGAPAAPAPRRVRPGWELTVPLPFAERPDVALTRWGDDLVVAVGEDRRSMRLDSLLRRCEVTGGRLAAPGTADARLEVEFRPDPQQWPADLLAAEERTP